ncbi:MAG: caspase family protein, partial [Terriglobales bacterium]
MHPYAHCQASHAEIRKEIFSDGVEHWYVVSSPNSSSYLWQMLQQICDVVFSKKAQPFGRSIAFLVGVGRYHNLPTQLETSVPNDLIEMRNLLLNDMAFDEVYVAKDDVVNRDRVEEYVKDRIGSHASKDDRLFFYYTGHGGDNQG